MVNKSEKEVADRYKREGWKVLHAGWPDFLCLRVSDGKIKDFKFVEVKSGDERLSYQQQVVRKVLERVGEYVVERVQNPSNQTNPRQSSPHQTGPRHAVPDQSKPNQATPSQTRPSQTNPNQTLFWGEVISNGVEP